MSDKIGSVRAGTCPAYERFAPTGPSIRKPSELERNRGRPALPGVAIDVIRRAMHSQFDVPAVTAAELKTRLIDAIEVETHVESARLRRDLGDRRRSSTRVMLTDELVSPANSPPAFSYTSWRSCARPFAVQRHAPRARRGSSPCCRKMSEFSDKRRLAARGATANATGRRRRPSRPSLPSGSTSLNPLLLRQVE
jgi:hypothetical protein